MIYASARAFFSFFLVYIVFLLYLCSQIWMIMGKKKNLPVLENITITGVAAEGKALVRINDIVTFVPNCVPGDVVDLQVTKKKHSFMEARVIRIVKPSEVRCEAKCKHFGVCGGCKWQILPYEEQLRYKQQQIVDNLTRIGKIELPEISPILGSKHIYEYRNKLEFTCADRKWFPWEVIEAAGGLDKIDSTYGLGFHIPGAFDKVLDIEECHLMPDINNRIRNSVRTYAREHGLTFYNEHTHEGLLRTLILRNNHMSPSEKRFQISGFRFQIYWSTCIQSFRRLSRCYTSRTRNTTTRSATSRYTCTQVRTISSRRWRVCGSK